LVGWLGMEFVSTDASVWPPQLVGLLMAALGMVFGSQVPSRRSSQP
jgi:solute:Na+ symporter, SSS family